MNGGRCTKRYAFFANQGFSLCGWEVDRLRVSGLVRAVVVFFGEASADRGDRGEMYSYVFIQ